MFCLQSLGSISAAGAAIRCGAHLQRDKADALFFLPEKTSWSSIGSLGGDLRGTVNKIDVLLHSFQK